MISLIESLLDLPWFLSLFLIDHKNNNHEIMKNNISQIKLIAFSKDI